MVLGPEILVMQVRVKFLNADARGDVVTGSKSINLFIPLNFIFSWPRWASILDSGVGVAPRHFYGGNRDVLPLKDPTGLSQKKLGKMMATSKMTGHRKNPKKCGKKTKEKNEWKEETHQRTRKRVWKLGDSFLR